MDKGMLIAWAVRILGTILAAKLGMEASDAATTAQQLVDGGLAVATGAWVLYSVIRHILDWRKKAGTRKFAWTRLNAPPALLLLPLVLLLAVGCASTAAYRMEAATAIGNSLTQLNVALDESADSIHMRIAAERAALWTAYQSDLAALVAKKLPDVETAAELVRLAKKYQDKQAIIDQSRVEVDRRFALATEHARFAQETLAQMYTFENDNLTMQAQLERYRLLANDYARKKFGLEPTATAPPAVTVRRNPDNPAPTN